MTAAIARMILALDEHLRLRQWRRDSRWTP
jgi:hypothetical protein